MYQLLIVDDHPLLRDALCASLQQHFPDVELIQAESLRACLSALDKPLDPDLIIFDLNLGDHQGVGGIEQVREAAPSAPILVISAVEDKQTILECLSLGAAGFVLKSQPSATFLRAVELVLAGQIYFPNVSQGDETTAQEGLFSRAQLQTLTSKQLQVLRLLGEGYPNKDICQTLCIAETTVKTHVSDILRKLNVKNRTQAALALNKDMLNALLAD